jgi:regulation of enolase protein 1 (concanavalin A-like superfamily)
MTVIPANKFCLILFMGCLFTSIAVAQNKPVKLPGIPYPLSWENTPLNYALKGSVLTIEAGAKTDMFRDPNVTYNTDNAPKLLFTADNDFVLTARIQHDFTYKWDGGAIVLKTDPLHWIKFCFEKDYTGIHRVVSVVTNDISDDCNSVAVTQNYVYYKIAKAANVITLYFSGDGTKWFLVRHLQFNAQGPLKLGFLAQSPTGTHNKVTFSNITYQHKKIKDPYIGE